jgi:1,4-dihydroxy-2-naphthoate octaprenyltransferase
MNARFWKGLWRIADPRLTLASVSSVLLGAAAAAREHPLAWGWLAASLFGILCLEVAKNAYGEISDYDSGADLAVAPEDRSPFSGGRRVLVDGILTRREVAGITSVTYALSIASGLAIAVWREPWVLAAGLLGTALAWFYYARPLRLVYRGFGEVAVALAYGPVICCGTYLVQRHTVSLPVLLLSLPLGLLIAAFLWINEFPDYRADLGAGKRNLVVILGRKRASRVFAVIVLAAFAIQASLPALALPRAAWLGLAALPLGVAAARRALTAPEVTARIIPAQAWTLQSFVLLSLATSLGLFFRR